MEEPLHLSYQRRFTNPDDYAAVRSRVNMFQKTENGYSWRESSSSSS